MSIGSIGSIAAVYTPPLNTQQASTPKAAGNDPDHDGDVDGPGPDKDGNASGVNVLA